jgi:hypothetical protein
VIIPELLVFLKHLLLPRVLMQKVLSLLLSRAGDAEVAALATGMYAQS